ncbi:MAG: DEAD/DEAH box helicase [Acidimicrobiales bacterium]|jgi:superfamily II RNA helicase
MAAPPLLRHLPDEPDAGNLLDGFLDFVADIDLELYEAQEEAILEFLDGNHVILSTPTGSGKSMVALAAHFAAVAKGQRSYYTAPVKALVSEKFFALCRDLGSDNVGMVTGDAAVNPDAPVICCTQEILANLALRDGAGAKVHNVVVDEFHYYSDRDRGWAWQVPLLELTNTQFLLMSATLGPTATFETDLERRSGRAVSTVGGTIRPVPLTFSYRETPLLQSIEELLEMRKAPVYIVHFTQRAATERAQSLTSIDFLTKDEKARIKEEISGFRFDSPFGKDIKRYLQHGIGVHHAGLLPKYRLLVEKLAQAGLLKLICGTDTLGVGVNVPIRTVLFTQLCKYDGQRTRILTVRDFQQIAGRAGRKGFDDEGFVWCQAPEHVVENIKALHKAGDDPKKRRKVQRKKAPDRGYIHWDEQTFERLQTGQPEPLTSSFDVSHAMLLNVLDRPATRHGDGCSAMKHLLIDNHEPRVRQRKHIRRAISIFRSLVEAEIVERLDRPDADGRTVRVNIDLQAEFSLNQPLSPFVLDVLELLDEADPSYALDVVTIVEAVQENPGIVLARQVDLAKTALMNEMKAAGVEYDERIERLDEVEWPKPLGDFLYENFNAWSTHHPWVDRENIRPKSVVRDLFERAMTFREYVNHYGLKGVEGVLLRYLTDVYKGLIQNVPESTKTEDLRDITEWLGALVRQVDSSLIDEWDRLRNPDPEVASTPNELRPPSDDITRHTRAFSVMVRNELFRWVQMLARESYIALSEYADGDLADYRELEVAISPYYDDHQRIDTGPDARSSRWFIDRGRDETQWKVEQILVDPEQDGEWRIGAHVDLDASRETGEAVMRLTSIHRL